MSNVKRVSIIERINGYIETFRLLLAHKIPITFHNLGNILSSRKDEQGKKSMISIEAIPDICLWRTILSITRTRTKK